MRSDLKCEKIQSCELTHAVVRFPWPTWLGSLITIYAKLCQHGPLARYVYFCGLRMRRECRERSPPPRLSDPDMYQGTCVAHVPGCIPGSMTSGFLLSRWRGKRSRHSRRMRNPQFTYLVRSPRAALRYGNQTLEFEYIPWNMHTVLFYFFVLLYYCSWSIHAIRLLI